MQTSDDVTAACLTPPGTGGIALIQLVGRGAPVLLEPFLRTLGGKPLDLPAAGKLRVARLVEGEQAIDDVVVAARRDVTGRFIIDLNLHGGPWIVQRTLLMLKHAGARIVDPTVHAACGCGQHALLAQETTHALLQVSTCPVARLIAQTAQALPEQIQAMTDLLARGELESVRRQLIERCQQARGVARLFAGSRVVLTGGPNSGKSTLANLLGGRASAIVSPHAGTTRDWTEHPAAIDGVPFTFVDTAGLRDSDDAIEQEAIRRGRNQTEPADAVLYLIDGSAPLSPPDERVVKTQEPPPRGAAFIPIWTKSDLPVDPSHKPYVYGRGEALSISARTGAGVDSLRARLMDVLGLAIWRRWTGAPFTRRQADAFSRALSALQVNPPDVLQAAGTLNSVVGS